MPQDDPPPPMEAMRHMMQMLPPMETGMAFAALRTLPAAARWRLAAWIVAGLEPTQEMLDAVRREAGCDEGTFGAGMVTMTAKQSMRAMLAAAAQEAGDGE